MTIDGLRIPKGTHVEVNTAVIHHDRKVWGENVDDFKVERWEHVAKGTDAASPYALLAFSQGPRICPGRTFALAEMKVVLLELMRLRAFDLCASGKTCVSTSNSDAGMLPYPTFERIRVNWKPDLPDAA